ncbi:hypothetical protein BJAS_P4327 [Bathymodiolus japonicus methanotrophic gill symbiont]|uniref:hypothetical protein n=1 Tax=Bathymodiolus japonicus methanotrophic gill symbiont TaxID=113269 RepID=UPI001B53222D|nr:hypothetical protein [Bathymodiolus japonicus methanotrophic gill symbiont]GFO73499.1 hypothetical protein BJAS_P4327 [Bathymodiolus japonicus methanotrophic gill symbiont]
MATTNGSTAIRDKILASLARYRALRIGKFPCAFWRLSARPGLTADVDWSQSKVIFISPTYTVYQKESINFKDLPIELWEIKKFENDTVMYFPIKANQQTESINTISALDSTILTVSKEVKTYTESDHLDNKPTNIIEIYENLKLETLDFGEVVVKPNKQYIAFFGNTRCSSFSIPLPSNSYLHPAEQYFNDAVGPNPSSSLLMM